MWKPAVISCFAAGSWLLLAGAVVAGPQQSHACAGVIEADARLACYDQAFPPAAGAQADVVDLEARRKQAIEDYGLDKQQLIEQAPEELRAIEPDRIQGTVKSMFERQDGGRVVTLENGQVWLLTQATSRGRLERGDEVTIRDAAFGSHMLVTPGGIPLRAKRLQ